MTQVPHDDVPLFFEGNKATSDDVKDGMYTLYLGDRAEAEVHVFGSESALCDWASLRQDWKRVASMLGTETLARRAEGEDLTRAAKVHRTRYHRLLEDLDEISQETGLEGLDLLRRATVDAPAAEGPASHSAFLHAPPAAGQRLTFAWMPKYVPIYDFGWYGMDNRGTGLTFVAMEGGALYEDPFMRGRCLWFWGISFGTDLARYGFAGIASSGISS